MSNRGLSAPFWEVAAEIFGIAFLLSVALPLFWFGAVNFLAPEERHPLDFYSNHLRSRPCYYIIILAFFLGIFATVLVSDDAFALVIGTFPELSCAMYLQGLAILGNLLWRESVAASLVAALLYSCLSTSTALIVTIPTYPVERPGAIYASAHLLANIGWVLWAQEGIRRHIHSEGHSKLLPDTAEGLPQCWRQAVMLGNPAFLVLLNFAFGVLWQVDRLNLGFCFALVYSVLSCVMLLGCCRSYREGTEIEQVVEA